MRTTLSILAFTVLLGAGCSSSEGSAGGGPRTDAEWRADITTTMHANLLGEIDALIAAAKELQSAAPADAGWTDGDHRASIEAMKTAWIKARVAYEHIEGALAPLFPEIDASMDARYEDFLDELGGAGDPDPFDGEGVTGMHAIERVLWSLDEPAAVREREATELADKGYRDAAFPSNAAEAASFRTKLVQRLIDDATRLHDEWTPQRIDVAGAFTGLVSLMNEQLEKVNKASSSEEESRYSQRTMADIRKNLEGTEQIYAIFQPWLKTKDAAVDQRIVAGFDRLHDAYAQVSGDAIPQPPATWKSEVPEDNSAADRETPFGRLYFTVREAVDVRRDTSIVASMNGAAVAMGFSAFEADE
jgi:iron uptake system component EfeO